jgi:hypothetical protein
VRHRRSIDLLVPVRTGPVERPNDSRRSKPYWQTMTDSELRRVGEYLRKQVEAGHNVHAPDLAEACAEWRRRHPRS